MADKAKQTKTEDQVYERKRKKNAKVINSSEENVPDKGPPAKKVKDITYHTSTHTFKVGGYASTNKRKEADASGEQSTRSEKAASSKQQLPSIDGHSANSDADFVDNTLQIVLSNGVPKDQQGIPEPKKLRYAGFETRTTPKPLTDCVKSLTKDQKLAVASMGLESMLHLRLNKVRADLGEWVLESYDSKTSTLVTDRGDVKIVPKDVHLILGLPLGGRIIKLPGRTNPDTPIVQQFRHQYGGPKDSTVSCQKIVDKIQQSRVADDTFKLNFLVLFFSSMVESTKAGTSNQRILNGIEGTDDICALNWCEYVITCLRDTRDEWEGNKRSPYSGPITFLIALYIDMFEHRLCRIDRQIPAIKGIDDVVIAKRIKYETKQDGFCKGTTLLKRNEPDSINQSVEKVSAKHRKAQPLVRGKKTPTKLVKDSEKDARIDGSQDEDSNNDKEVQREVRVRKTPAKDASIAQSMEIVSHKNKEVQAEVGVKNTPFKLVTKVEKAAELLRAALENYNHAFKEAARQSNFKDRINKTNEEVWKCIDSYKEKRNQKHERQQSSKDPSLEEVNNIQEPILDANTVTKDQPSHTELHQPSSVVDIINPPSHMEQGQPVVELSLAVFKTPTTNATESHTQAYELHYGLHTRGPKGQDNPRNNHELPNPLLNLAEIMDLPTQVIEEAARLCNEQSAKVLVSKPIAFPEPVRRSNREIQPGPQLNSPFMGRVVQLTVPAPKVYVNFREWVYEGNCNDSDILFEYGVDCGERRDFCSLHPDKYITTPIIDLWAVLLNENEKYRSKNSLLRFFVTTKIAIGSAGKGGTEQSRAAQFKVLFEDELKKFPLVNVQEVSLFMFPICYRERYYLLCFDMVEFKIDIIDNMKEGTQDRYGHTIEIMTYNFLAYLKQVKHKKLYMFADVKSKRIDLSWQTENFSTDCGIFTMRHMETYKGGATTNWKCGLVNESEEQTEQLMALRDTYLNVILRSHLNARREKVLQRAREWLEIKDDLEYYLDNEALS